MGSLCEGDETAVRARRAPRTEPRRDRESCDPDGQHQRGHIPTSDRHVQGPRPIGRDDANGEGDEPLYRVYKVRPVKLYTVESIPRLFARFLDSRICSESVASLLWVRLRRS